MNTWACAHGGTWGSTYYSELRGSGQILRRNRGDWDNKRTVYSSLGNPNLDDLDLLDLDLISWSWDFGGAWSKDPITCTEAEPTEHRWIPGGGGN